MSMSADATCRGLRSARDGPLIMQFTKGKRICKVSMYIHIS